MVWFPKKRLIFCQCIKFIKKSKKNIVYYFFDDWMH